MQELLGRLTALDPDASHGLRVIACFDELVLGNVGTRALLSAAAALAGCPAGFQQDHPPLQVRVAGTGDLLPPAPPPAGVERVDGQVSWLDRDGPPGPHDAIIVERLALALRIRHGRGRAALADRRHMAVLLDATVPVTARREAASALGVRGERRSCVVVAPLFARWTAHPVVPEDVVPSPHGPLHVLVVPEGVEVVGASPSGTSAPTAVDDLPRALRTATTALRLWDEGCGSTSHVDRFGGLVELLVDLPDEPGSSGDVDRLEAVVAHGWGATTLEALVQAASVRQAARLAGVHHKTMTARVEEVTAALGFDPLAGYGRARLGVAWLRWRLRHSRVLDLPAPHRP
ncbi:PucR family transcriptional regulator [Quadrisphaera setariae]|uniref:PucR family transcriptional regulator n=1 Tax=Quadrisphaera setariae TaxID=2593304 RepID=A0A5C8ZIR6_9ACTN|nr:PucR family transcriptional regulator [Quadrisphaera setariae]TXR57001.1 PucR family transcriptional regulator [Quadrisphaera setariae]